MKGRHHLAAHTIILFAALAVITLSGKGQALLSSLFRLYLGEAIFVAAIGITLFFLGAILPDSDCNNRGSYIFYSRFFLLGWIVRLLEFPLALLLGRKVRHRQSMHTFLGIFASSLVAVIAVSLPYYWLISDSFRLSVPLFWFICLFIGQLLHLVEDWHFHFK